MTIDQLDLFVWAETQPSAILIDLRVIIFQRAFSGKMRFETQARPATVINLFEKRGAA